MYSEHGLDAVIRPVSGLVCQSLIVSSYWMPGSAHSHAAWATLRNRSLASTVSMTRGSARAQPEVGALLDRAHELVGDADGVVRVLVLDAGDVRAAEVHVETGVAQHADLVLLARLGLDELLDVGVVDVEDDHLRRAPGRAAGLDRAGRGIGAAHEADRAGRGAAGGQQFLRRADAREVQARTEPPLKIRPSSRYQFRIESIVSSTDRMKQALTCCGEVVPTLNQTGELKLNTWCRSIHVSSCSKISASSPELK